MNTVLITASHVNPAQVIAVDYNTNAPLVVGLIEGTTLSTAYAVEIPATWDLIDAVRIIRGDTTGAPAMPGPDDVSGDFDVTPFVDAKTGKRVVLCTYPRQFEAA